MHVNFRLVLGTLLAFTGLIGLVSCRTAGPTTAATAASPPAGEVSSKPAAAEYFPGEHWDKPAAPEQYGWSSEKLKLAKDFADTGGTAAVFIVHQGRLIYEWGPTERRYNVHSIRKSFISELYGRYIQSGIIRPTDTMAMLGIDDNDPKPTAVEKQATVSDLLRARSGVYHVAAYETESMKAARPLRGSHAPGTFWYYNNWDFNVLGTIFRNATHKTVGQELLDRIAKPLQMEDFRPQDATEELDPVSIHPAYPLRLSARDMARFGLMMLRQGRWRDQQIIARDWVAETTRSYSAVRDAKGNVQGGYGYMWWTTLAGRHLQGVDLPDGSFSARGAGGHHILVIPGLDLVIVHRVDTDALTRKPVDQTQFGGIVKRILEAMPADERQHPTSRPADPTWLPGRLDSLVPGLMTQHKVPGVSIVGIEHGRIAWDRQYGVRCADDPRPVDSQTVFEAASMTKPTFGYVVMKLVEQGKLDLDRPLDAYLDNPYLPNEPRAKSITARMVLSHTTGLPNWRKGGLKSGGPIELIADPGTRFTYSGEGILYLQNVVEHITGTPFQPYMREHLLDPLGLVISSTVWEDRFGKLAAAGHDAEGKVKPDRAHYANANAAYSLYCTPGEYAAFLVEIMRPDRSAPCSISSESIAAMLKPTTLAAGREPTIRGGSRQSEVSHYGLGWAVEATAAGDRITHSGSNGTGFRCYCEFDRRHGDGIVIMTNAEGGAPLWHDILAAVGKP